jgi:O-succinylbenzoic acid--CoA ligase
MAELYATTLNLNGTWLDKVAIQNTIASVKLGAYGQEEPLLQKVFLFLEQWLNSDSFITLQTSGSTGLPKQIRINKEYLLRSAQMTGDFFSLQPGMSALLCLSPDYIAGKMMVVRAMVLRLNLIVAKTESNPIQNLEQDIDFAAMVPLQVGTILKVSPEKLDRIKTLIIGGGPLSLSLEDSLQLSPTHCWHTYAMTETVSHIAARPVNGINRTNWFIPMPGVSVSVDSRSCLVIKAPQLAEGMIITNDLAELSGTKFRITGRIDDVIVSAGFKLLPQEIEKKLSRQIQIPFFLIGKDHPEAGQIAVLFIEGTLEQINITSLKSDLEHLLEPHEVPRKILMITRFKYLESGKIDRRATFEEWNALKND